jgi:predicted ATPase
MDTPLTFLGEALSQIRIYREWVFGRKNPSREPQKADLPNDFLNHDATNLGLVLNRFRMTLDVKRTVIEYLSALYPGIEDFEVIIQGETTQVFIQEKSFIIPATRLSDGTLRYLCLLAILCHPNPPPLVCIEEPELGLHPDVLPSLARLMVEASDRMQIVVTTHSDILVDAMTETPENVVVCEKSDSKSTLSRLDANILKPWLEKYRLGELWTRGEVGGNRW